MTAGTHLAAASLAAAAIIATMADAADALWRELSALKLSALRRRALSDGVEETALDLASDGADRGC